MQYFSLNPVLSRGAIISFVIGLRSAGKTYSFKEWAIKDWINNRSEFVYARRIDDEIKAVKSTLFDDISFKYNLEVKTKGNTFFARPLAPEGEEIEAWKKKTPWERFGYIYSIADQQSIKSASFPKVNKICLDEFIIENSRRKYMQSEVEQFLSLILTVARDRKVKVVAFSNSGFISNPYFEYYNINSQSFANSEFVKRNSGDVIFQLYKSQENSEKMKNSLVGRISGESYKEYAFENKFKDISTELVIDPKKFSKINHFYNVKINNKNFILCAFELGMLLKPGEDRSKNYYTIDPFSTGKEVYDPNLAKKLRSVLNKRKLFFTDSDSRAIILSDLY